MNTRQGESSQFFVTLTMSQSREKHANMDQREGGEVIISSNPCVVGDKFIMCLNPGK